MTISDLPRQVSIFIEDEALSRKMVHMLGRCCPQMEIVSCCHTPQEAAKTTFESAFPPRRLIFVDDSILFQIPNFLSHLDSIGARCDGILLLNVPDFFKLQRAVRCGVEDCLLASFDEKELECVLERLSSRIHHRDRSVPREAQEAKRYLFWRNDVRRLNHMRMTIAQVNSEYGTNFSEGLFRALFIEMTCKEDSMRIVDNRELQEQIIQQASSLLREDCFDILYNRHSNGVSMLMNYPQTKRSCVAEEIHQLFLCLKKQFWEEKQIDITMSIGRIYGDFYKLPEIKQEILDARWARKQLGVGRIINAEDIQTGSQDVNLNRQIRNDQDMILHYVELLDVERTAYYSEQFFLNYRNVLSARQIRVFFRDMRNLLIQNYNTELQCYGDPEMLRHAYINREVTAESIESYVRVVIENNRDIMQKVETVVRRQYSQPIKDCVSYISQHHCRDITLQKLADLVQLTPQYLSSRFHRETGLTITEYINDQKMRLAKNMLIHSDRNISEIADYLGFTDVRYFSKFFKAHQHVTPTEYRRVKQASDKKEIRQK